MKKRFGRMIIGGIFGMFIGCISVLALSDTSVNYHFFSKKTAVHIQYYTNKDGRIISLEEIDRNVLPGEYISRIPIIQNEGIDCYIRVKVTITSEKEPSVPLSLEHIVGLGESWIPIGDYFYYEDVLLEDEAVKVFEGICMPQGWVDPQDCGNRWEVCVKADAIQAKYLEPNFLSEDPWGEKKETIEILDAKEEDALEDSNVKGGFCFTIKSEAEDFQIEKKETFQNMGGFVPGDVKEHEIILHNLDKKERTLYMSMEVPKENTLLEEMELSILWKYENREIVLYKGLLAGAQDVLERETLVLLGGAKSSLYVQFSLPKTADNSWASQEGSLCLVFSEERIWPGNSNVQDDSTLQDNSAVQTGDDSKIWKSFVGLSIGVCLFFLYLWKGKRGSYDK